MSGYVITVATVFENAPNTKALAAVRARGVASIRREGVCFPSLRTWAAVRSLYLSCSKTVYWFWGGGRKKEEG